MPDRDGKLDSEEEVIDTTTLPDHRDDKEVKQTTGNDRWTEEKHRGAVAKDYATELQEMRRYWRQMMMDMRDEKKIPEKKVLTLIRAMLVLETNGAAAKDRIAAMKSLGDTFGFNKQIIEHSTPESYGRELDRLLGGLPNDDN